MRIARSILLIAFVVVSGAAAPAQDNLLLPPPDDRDETTTEPPGTFAEQLSYCLGIDLGRRLRSDDVDVDLGALMAGLRDGLSEAAPALSEQQIAQVMGRFQQQLQQRAEAQVAKLAEENLARGEAFLAENRGKEGVKETDSGLQYRVLEKGDGPSPGPSDTVRCHYEGKLISGEVFDSSYQRGQPAEFPVGGVITGWTEALQQMEVGGKWQVFLPPSIAYGSRGAGGAIGPNETLIFQIELLDIVR